VHHLREAGIDAVNLSGGIDAWSREIDKKVPIY
jgi:rhodanese-related sulfurtransferase